MSGGTRTVRVSTAVKVAKEKKSKKGASAVKGKKTPEYGVMTFGEDRREGQDDQVVEFKAIKCKGHLTNEQNEGAR